jgi:hypothetical protein
LLLKLELTFTAARKFLIKKKKPDTLSAIETTPPQKHKSYATVSPVAFDSIEEEDTVMEDTREEPDVDAIQDEEHVQEPLLHEDIDHFPDDNGGNTTVVEETEELSEDSQNFHTRPPPTVYLYIRLTLICKEFCVNVHETNCK